MSTTTELSELADRVSELDLKLHELRREEHKPQTRMTVIRAQLVLEIGSAKDSSGKPLYRNEPLRNAALTVKLAENEEFQQLIEQRRAYSTKYDEIVAERSKLLERRRALMIELGTQPPPSDFGKPMAPTPLLRTQQEIDNLQAMFDDLFDALSQPEISDDVDFNYMAVFADALNWFSGRISTEELLSPDFMNFERLQRISAHEAEGDDFPIPRLIRPSYSKKKRPELSPLEAENADLRARLKACDEQTAASRQ